jgi:hypothetical protein
VAASRPTTTPDGDRPAVTLLAGLSAAKLLIHLLLANRYGYFRDELYFLDCGRHLDWGYVDHAPLIGLVARGALLLGGSLPALRIFPAAAGAALVALTGLIAWRLGGGRFAQGLAGLAVIVMPIYLGIDSILTMNAFEPLFWMGCVYLLIRIIQTGQSRLWVPFGILAGLGLMNKHSAAFFLLAIGVGLLLSPERRELRKPGPWLALVVALLIFLPNLAWQVQHDFPTLEDLRNVARIGKNVVLGPAAFLGQQVLIIHPVLFPVWLAGLVYLVVARRGRFRALGFGFAAFFLMLFALKGKNYYLAPIYPMLLAAGAVAIEVGLARGPAWLGGRGPRIGIVILILAAGALTAPLVLPLLPPQQYVAYQAWLGVSPPPTEVHHQGPLPQLFGDQFGWEELTSEVARIYAGLSPEERARAAIFANNYGEAGAIDLFGPRYGLPAAISAHQTYFYWGPRGFRGDVVIVLQDNRQSLERLCASVEQAGEHYHPWGMEEENGPIFVCRGLRTPLVELWPRLKNWN